MHSSSSVRRVAATVTIASLSIAALMGIAALLGAGELGEGEARVLLTTLAVGLASTSALCCLAVADSRYAGVGLLGGVLTAIALLIALALIWGDGADGDGPWQAFGVAVVLAATVAQACLLLAMGDDEAPMPLLTAATLVAAGLLGALLCLLILSPEVGDGAWRVIGVLAILDVLGTLVSMALGAVRRVAAVPQQSPVAAEGRAATLPPALVDRLARHAHATGRSVDDLLAEAVSDYLAAHSR